MVKCNFFFSWRRRLNLFFFFSSRSRHTRFDCDWSSDVCSSDLAVDDGLVRQAEFGTREAVHQNGGGRHREAREGAAHGENTGAADVEAVDFTYTSRSNGYRERALTHQDGEALALAGGAALGIVQAADPGAAGRKHDGRGHHWSSQGAAACFVESGDNRPPQIPERDFTLEGGAAVAHAGGCSVAGSLAGTATAPRFSRMRAALPASRRRKYSLARRTRPFRTSSSDAIDGECNGKMRSTPTPAEIFRTVNVSLMPPPRRAMHTPSNACTRSFSPSRTRTITRSVSPGSKVGRSVRRPSRSIALSLCITLAL